MLRHQHSIIDKTITTNLSQQNEVLAQNILSMCSTNSPYQWDEI